MKRCNAARAVQHRGRLAILDGEERSQAIGMARGGVLFVIMNASRRRSLQNHIGSEGHRT